MKKFLLIILAIGMFACGNEVLKEYHTFSDLLWHKSDVVKFETDIKTPGKYKIYFPLRYTQGCPYKSISVNIKITFPDGKEKNIDKEIKIMDDNNKYIGEGAGDIWDTEELIEDNYNFDKSGKYKIEITQTTSQETLAFIMEVGLRITPVSTNE